MKYKETKKKLEALGVEYRECEDNGNFMILACAVGDDNFYDYGERCKPIVFNRGLEWIANNPFCEVYDCSECCGCAGW